MWYSIKTLSQGWYMILYGYARLSKEDQDEHGLTLEVQRKRLIKDGVPPHNIYSDYQSGDDNTRLQYRQLLAQAYQMREAGQEVEIVVTRLDRLSRDDHELERVIGQFDDLGIKFRALEGGYYSTLEVHDWQRVKLEGFIAQTYLRQLSSNVRRRKAEQRAQGIPIYGKTPFGYVFNDNKTQLIVHPEEGGLIRKWIKDFLDGSSVRNLVRISRQDNSPKSKGFFNRVLVLPVYRGHLEYTKDGMPKKEIKRGLRYKKEKIIVYNTHEALITPQQDIKIRQRLIDNKRYTFKKDNWRTYSLSGLVICDECSRRMVIYRAGKNRQYQYFRCPGFQLYKECSQNKGIRVDILEPMVEAELRKRSFDLAQMVATPDLITESAEVLELRRQIRELEDMMNRSGLISLEGAIEEARARLKNLTDAPIEITPTESIEALTEGLSNEEAWRVLTVDDKRILFLDLVRSIRVREGQVVSIILTF